MSSDAKSEIDIFVLDIGTLSYSILQLKLQENMLWNKMAQKTAIPTPNIQADVVGEKIYIQSAAGNEFSIFDPRKQMSFFRFISSLNSPKYSREL